MRRLLPVVLLLLLGTALPARADDAAAVAMALRSSPVYQAPGLDLVDVATVSTELSGRDPRVLLALLPAGDADSDGQARSRAVEIGTLVADSGAVVLVVTADHHFGAGEGHAAYARGVRAVDALQAERAVAGSTALTKDGLTALVTAFAERVANQAASGGTATARRSSSSGRGTTWLVALLVVGAGGALLVARSSRGRRQRLNEGLRADVEQLYARLGSDVATLDPGDDKVAKQALADAAERFNACGAALAEADAPAEFAAARRTAVEGLTAARAARVALGLDPGPEIPVVPGDGPQLAGPQQVEVGGETYEGSPQYEPGRQHYFGGGTLGGRPVPGGWYSTPFWEPFLLGTLLSGGLGGFGGGPQAPGGDWGGSSGGGDWGGDGGGGGDW